MVQQQRGLALALNPARLRLAERWDWPLCAILGLSFCLNSFAFDYALPYPPPAEWQPAHFSKQNWAFDSIAPVDPLAAGRDLFSWGRWSQRVYDYPLAHYLVLGVAYAPYLLWVYLSNGFATSPSPGYPYGLADPTTVLSTLTLIARAVAVLMGAGIVALVYAITREFFDRRAALFAALAASCNYALVVYAHTENLDVPYLFWGMLALWAFARFYRKGGVQAAALIGVGAALAVATKDQAYALFTLLPVPILIAHRRHVPMQPLWRWLIHPHLLAGLLGFAGAYVIGNNLIFNWPRFWLHLGYLRANPGYDRYLDPASLADWGRLFALTLHHLQAAMGAPLLIVGVVGVAYALWRHRASWPLLVPLVSYYGLFIYGNLFYVHVRHMLPVAILLTPFAGAPLADAISSVRVPRPIAVVGLMALFGYSLAYATTASLTFAFDSRKLAGDWMEANIPAGARVEVYAPRMFLPRYLLGYEVTAADFGGEGYLAGLRARAPEVVIVTERQYRVNADQPEAELFARAAQSDLALRALLRGEAGYRLAADFKFKLHDWLYTDSFNGQNPRILIFTRAEE